jgi:hypothetical protein
MNFSQARHAIYIDFEALKTMQAQPAVLGILIGSDDEELQQLTDERLAPARVAKADRIRVITTAVAVDTIVNKAWADTRRIVGWSYFDRDRLMGARPHLPAHTFLRRRGEETSLLHGGIAEWKVGRTADPKRGTTMGVRHGLESEFCAVAGRRERQASQGTRARRQGSRSRRATR